MPRVRNKETGLEFSVPPGHYSLSSSLFEVLPESKPAAPKATEPEKPKSKSKK